MIELKDFYKYDQEKNWINFVGKWPHINWSKEIKSKCLSIVSRNPDMTKFSEKGEFQFQNKGLENKLIEK